MQIPNKEELIADLIAIIDDDETTDFECLAALKVLKKADSAIALEKALNMRKEGKKRVPVTDLLLSLIPVKKKETMPMVDLNVLERME